MDKNIFYYFIDNDDYTDFIKNVEATFRKSREYSMWLSSFDHDTCAATGHTKSIDGAKIEVHHYGKTLYDWVSKIVDSLMLENLPLNTFFICMVLTSLHFRGCITYVPLLRDIHVMLHNDFALTTKTYPTILDGITYGNYELAEEIIKEYVDELKIQYNQK